MLQRWRGLYQLLVNSIFITIRFFEPPLTRFVPCGIGRQDVRKLLRVSIHLIIMTQWLRRSSESRRTRARPV